jgi:hypothetical protein
VDVSWFSKSATIVEPVPAPVVDRVEALVEELREVDARLASLDAEMLAFRTRYSLRTDRFGRIIAAQATVNGFAAIQLEWQALLKRSDQLFFKRNDILQAWSAAKMERK